MSSPKPTRSLVPPRGFTLIEIMVVVMILGLLSTLVLVSVTDSADRAREETARTNAATIAGAVRMFRAREGRLPESLAELVAPDPKGRCDLEHLPRDPWGGEFALTAGAGAREWLVVSAGPDRIAGSDDDIRAGARAE